MLKPQKKSTLYELVLGEIISAIKKGHWKPGEKLPTETTLAGKLNVSRSVIREVIKALTLYGVVESKPGHGTYLSQRALINLNNSELLHTISQGSSFVELMEVRMIIETQAAFWAAQRAKEKDIKKLEKILDKEKELQKPDTDIHAKFHDAIVELSGNKLLLQIYNSIRSEISLQRKKFAKFSVEDLKSFSAQHYEILNAIKNKNAEKARSLMEKHILKSLDLTNKFIAEEAKGTSHS
ncbi:FadR/GntR family transcriptional regulator [Thermovirga sp.]|uniref:FadR/GntR family transcriptional regulator n=1 Tax=Thermovirga sp. TaxID=2699834 RepID=UPI0025EF52C1|nr:FadR/GntR family transcriptional regulator [Thermovirga sp.]MBO8154038.1 FadR family transcriptional regulator [Thermovirga sp.]